MPYWQTPKANPQYCQFGTIEPDSTGCHFGIRLSKQLMNRVAVIDGVGAVLVVEPGERGR